MRVMTYNIRHGLGTDGVLDLSRIARVIAQETPDFVAIQEIDRFWSRSGGVDQPEELAAMLDMQVCYAPNLEMPPERAGAPPVQYGVAILSRFPIGGWNHTRFPEVDGWEPRGLLAIEAEIAPGQRVGVFCTHLQVSYSGNDAEGSRQRAEQVAIVRDLARSMGIPAIIMGDFNAEPDAGELASLLGNGTGFQDAWLVSGAGTSGFTVPAAIDREAERRIDYILVSPDIDVVRCRVTVDGETRLASDHFPVVADLSLDSGGLGNQ